jgi:hypothetical protein
MKVPFITVVFIALTAVVAAQKVVLPMQVERIPCQANSNYIGDFGPMEGGTNPALRAEIAKPNAGAPNGSVSLTCTAGTSGAGQGAAMSFNFYRATATTASCPASGYVILGTSPMLSSCAYADTTVSPNTTYCYTATDLDITVGATCPAGVVCESGQSSPLLVTVPALLPPNPPTGLTAGQIVAKSVPLQWKAPAAQAGVIVESYNVLRCHEARCPDPPLAATVTATKYTDTCDYTNLLCYYEITANDLVGGVKETTGPSNIVEAKVN